MGIILMVQGCATTDEDELRAAYMAGELSPAEYEAACLAREEAFARACASHAEFLYSCRANDALLPPP